MKLKSSTGELITVPDGMEAAAFEAQSKGKIQEFVDMLKERGMAKKGGLIKRKDGSYSRRGLWDNIRANRGSGRKPTKEMLKQEKKIRAKQADGGAITTWKSGPPVNRNTSTIGKKMAPGGPVVQEFPTIVSVPASERSHYDQLSDTMYISEKDRYDPGLYPHEIYHRGQYLNDELSLPQFWEGPLKRPTIPADPNNPNLEAYYNRRPIDADYLQYQFLEDYPEFKVVPGDLVYNKFTDPVMYQLPYTLEGEAQEFSSQFAGPKMGKGGYTVRRSSARKGKTHVVIGPDGTKKYFGDRKLGQHPKDAKRKKAFYARHAKNLKKNPYFRAFARATWDDGGEINGEYPVRSTMTQMSSQQNGDFNNLTEAYTATPDMMSYERQSGPAFTGFYGTPERSEIQSSGPAGESVRVLNPSNPEDYLMNQALANRVNVRAGKKRGGRLSGNIYDLGLMPYKYGGSTINPATGLIEVPTGYGELAYNQRDRDLYKKGGWLSKVGNIVADAGKAVADTALSTIGSVTSIDALKDVVKDQHYKTAAFDKASNVAGGLGDINATVAKFIPGVNVIAGAAGGVGALVDRAAGIDKRYYDPSQHQSKFEKAAGGIKQVGDIASMFVGNPSGILGKGVELGAKTSNVIGKIGKIASLGNLGVGTADMIKSGNVDPMQLLQLGLGVNSIAKGGFFSGANNVNPNAGASTAGAEGGSPFGSHMNFKYGGNTRMDNGGQSGLVPINVEGANFSQGSGPDAKKGELLVLNGKIIKNYVGRPPHPAEGQNPLGNDDAPEGLIVIPKARTKEYLEAGLTKRKQMERSLVSQQQDREMKKSKKMGDGGYYSFGMGDQGMAYGGPIGNPETIRSMMEWGGPDAYKKGGWIQKATKSIKRRGTEGVCTGSKFGSSSCPPGSRRYNLAKTFRKMAKARKHEHGGFVDPVTGSHNVMYEMGGPVNVDRSAIYNGLRDRQMFNLGGAPETTTSNWDYTGSYTPAEMSNMPGVLTNAGTNPVGMPMYMTNTGDYVLHMDKPQTNPVPVSTMTSSRPSPNWEFRNVDGRTEGRLMNSNASGAQNWRPVSENWANKYRTRTGYAVGGGVYGSDPYAESSEFNMAGRDYYNVPKDPAYYLTSMPSPRTLDQRFTGTTWNQSMMDRLPKYTFGEFTSNRQAEPMPPPTSSDQKPVLQAPPLLSTRIEESTRKPFSEPRNTITYTGSYNNALNALDPEARAEALKVGVGYNRDFDSGFNLGASGDFSYMRNPQTEDSEGPSIMRDANLKVTGGYEGDKHTFKGNVGYNPYQRTFEGSATGTIKFKEGGKLPKTLLEARMKAAGESERKIKDYFANYYAMGGNVRRLRYDENTVTTDPVAATGTNYSGMLQDVAGLTSPLWNLGRYAFEKPEIIKYDQYMTPDVKFKPTKFDETPFLYDLSLSKYRNQAGLAQQAQDRAMRTMGYSTAKQDFRTKEALREQSIQQMNAEIASRNKAMQYQIALENMQSKAKRRDFGAKSMEQIAQTFGRDPRYFHAIAGSKEAFRAPFTGWFPKSEKQSGG